MYRLTRLAVFPSILCLGVIGCGDSSPYSKVEVSGTVLYEDGSVIPVDKISLRFESLEPPIDPKTHPRPGIGYTEADGSFSVVTTNKYADGIIRGRHKVLIAAAADANGKRLIPKEYSRFNTTPIEIDASDAPFDFRVPKP